MWLIYFRLVKVRHLAGSHKSFGFFSSRNGVFCASKRTWMGFESNDVYVGAFCPTKRTALRSLMQRAAMAVAVRCGGWCSALLYSLLCRSEGLPADFCVAFPRLRLCFLRAWAGCERGWVPPAGGLRGGGLRSARPENVKREGCLDGNPSRLLLYLVWLACLCVRRSSWSISPSKVSPNARVRL